MAKKLYVGNMSYNTTESELREVFEAYGPVTSVNIISDRDTGRPKGFGFVEMETDDAAQAAINSLNGSELDGRQLKVNEANAKPDRPRRDSYRF